MSEQVQVVARPRRDTAGDPARVLAALPEAVLCIDAAGTVTEAWGACFPIFGEDREALIGLDAYSRLHPADIGHVAGALVEALSRTGEHIPIDVRIRAADGSWVRTEAAAGYLDDDDTLLISLRPLAYRGHLEERRAELQLRCLDIAASLAPAHGEQLEHALLQAVATINEFFHTAAARFSAGAGRWLEVGDDVDWPEPDGLTPGTFRQHPRRGGHTVIEVPVPATGSACWLLAWSDADPGMAGWDGCHLDDVQLTGALLVAAVARQALEADLLRRSREDVLTGLPNRAELERQLQQRLDAGPVTVMFCDLDGYKVVNDRYGHHVGDRVLAVVAARLAATMRPGDLLARIGGDEFVAVCAALSSEAAAKTVARLERALAEPVRIDDVEVTVGVSVGAATGGPGIPAAQLLAAADSEMYAVKATRQSAG